jgi:hypothetical protein
VPQGIEFVDGKPIVYSIGNFVFKQGQPWTNYGLWAELTLTDEHPRGELSVLPLAVGYTPAFATGADSARVMAHLDSISRRIPAHPRLPNPQPRRNVAHP